MKTNFQFTTFAYLQIGFSQNNLLWQGYFSFNEIKAISSSSTTIYAASENALFSANALNNQINTTTTVDDLQDNSALYYSAIKSVIIGENGLLIWN
jgi:hypothetical protein